MRKRLKRLIALEQIPRVNLVLNIIQARVVAVGNNGLTTRFERL